jgi:hypothetical protein
LKPFTSALLVAQLAPGAVCIHTAHGAGARFTVGTISGGDAARPLLWTIEIGSTFEAEILDAARRRAEVAAVRIDQTLHADGTQGWDIAANAGAAIDVDLALLTYAASAEIRGSEHAVANAAAVDSGFTEVLDAVLAMMKALPVAARLIGSAAVVSTANGVTVIAFLVLLFALPFLFLIFVLALFATFLLGGRVPLARSQAKGGQHPASQASQGNAT